MFNICKSIVNYLFTNFPSLMYKLAYAFLPKDVINQNLDLTDPNQKRVLVSYISLLGVDLSKVDHAAYYHYNQIIHYFISRGYCVDSCFCNDASAYERLKDCHYDIIIGFGKLYKIFCERNNIPLRICFITENNPEVVTKKYHERVAYFKKRHPSIKIKNAHIRNEYFDIDQFRLSQYAIHMSSHYNANTLLSYFNKVITINANALFNKRYVFDEDEVLNSIRMYKNNFLWFGSHGFIHKGVDLLMDVFRDYPEFHLDLYGIGKDEYPLYKKLASSNTSNCGKVRVQSKEFIEEIVMRHSFLVFPSCSEGMSTAVCTCMAHGIIPIVLKECGFEPHSSIIELRDYTVDAIKDAVVRAVSMTDDEILMMRKTVYEYGQKNFSLENFDIQFQSAMNEILSKAEENL